MGRSGVTLGSLREHFGIISGRFGVVSNSFSVLFRPFMTLLGGVLGHFRPKTRHFGGFGSKKCIKTLKPYVKEDT